MTRALRPRKARPSYAAIFGDGSDIDGGSSSDGFQPPTNHEDDVQVNRSASESSEGVDAPAEEGDVLVAHDIPNIIKKSKKSTKQSKSPLQAPALSSILSRPGKRQQYALPMPASDHRHRSKPLYWHSSRVERLGQSPTPFGPSATVPTNNSSSDKTVYDRYNKASGHNIGRGPIWNLMEDRSWFKESQRVPDREVETEFTRRPRVHEAVEVEDFEIICVQEIAPYIPSNVSSSGSSLTSSIKCSFGLPGKETLKEFKTYDSMKTSEYFHESNTCIFFAGGPVWGLDWCPIFIGDHPHRSYKQYLAVAPLPSSSHSPYIGVKCTTPSPACIQIWSFSSETSVRPETSSTTRSKKGKEKDTGNSSEFGVAKCELVLCFDCGPAQEIKWCPLPSHDSWETKQTAGARKLGILAGTFEDGSMSISVVPDPDDLQPQIADNPIYIKIKPIIRVELEETSIWTVDWANSERLAVGCTNGSIAVYDIKDALTYESLRDLLPTHYISVHQSAIRSLRWIQVPKVSADGILQFTDNPSIITSGGYDGCEILTDLREGISNTVNRTRDVAVAMTYSLFSIGVVSIDLENIVKTFTMSPSMLGRGHHLVEAGGPIWSLHTSDYHSHLAVGSADGSVLTTNILKSTRRSAATPFIFYKIFQLDYSRNTGYFRMLEQFLPQEVPDKSSSGRNNTKQAADSVASIFGTGAWSPEVSVTRVAWNNGGGLARAPLLASATASGLCRIDWLLGQFHHDKIPYGGIDLMRNEVVGNKIEEDDDD